MCAFHINKYYRIAWTFSQMIIAEHFRINWTRLHGCFWGTITDGPNAKRSLYFPFSFCRLHSSKALLLARVCIMYQGRRRIMHGYLILWYKTFKKCFVRLNAPGMRCKNAFSLSCSNAFPSQKVTVPPASEPYYINSHLIIIINCYFSTCALLNHYTINSYTRRKLNYAKRPP